MRIQRLTWAGHSAVFLEAGELRVVIDPWLEGNPKCPPALQRPAKLDLIVLTHGHSDHASEAAGIALRTGASIAATWELGLMMAKEGVPEQQILFMNKGGTVDFRGLAVTLTHALHSSSYDTPHGPVYTGEACGVCLGDGRRTIYHAGDTALFSDMSLIGEEYRPRIALLPIGDRFTMGPRQAATAAGLLGCKVAIPIHWGTFDLLTGRREHFAEECSKQDVEVPILEPGDTYSID